MPMEFLFSDALQWSKLEHSGVVDENIDLSQSSVGLLEYAVHISGL